MKIGFIAENRLEGIEADARFAHEHNFDGLEFNYWDDFRDLTEATVKAMAAILKKHHVHASMLGLWGWNHLAPDPAQRAEAHAMLGRAIGFARLLGAEHFVTGAGDIPNEPVGRKVAEFLKVFPPFLKKIEKAGLKPAFYAVHGASFLDSLETFERVWEQMPELKMKYDPANWRQHGDDYLDVVRRYGNKIGYVHIKEHLYKDGALISQPAAGMGDIEFPKVLAFLYEFGYDGWLSIEPHGPVWGHGEMRRRMLVITRRYLSQFVV